MHHQFQYLMAEATSQSLLQCDATIDDLDEVIDRMEAIGDWDACNSLMNAKADLMIIREDLRVRLLRMSH